jgi:hypothetical protein
MVADDDCGRKKRGEVEWFKTGFVENKSALGRWIGWLVDGSLSW